MLNANVGFTKNTHMDYEDAQQIVTLFDSLLFSAEPKMKYEIARQSKDYQIAAPSIIIEVFKIGLSLCYAPAPAAIYGEDDFFYKGVKVIPGYEMALVLYHKDYSRYNYAWMIHKVSFDMNGSVLGLDGAIGTIKKLYSISGPNYT